MNRVIGCPSASSTVQRNISSAAGLKSTMRWPASTVMMASMADSRIPASCSRLVLGSTSVAWIIHGCRLGLGPELLDLVQLAVQGLAVDPEDLRRLVLVAGGLLHDPQDVGALHLGDRAGLLGSLLDHVPVA